MHPPPSPPPPLSLSLSLSLSRSLSVRLSLNHVTLYHQVAHLTKQLALLSKEIWVYCESGAYEKGQTDVDLRHLVGRLKALGLDSDVSGDGEEGPL